MFSRVVHGGPRSLRAEPRHSHAPDHSHRRGSSGTPPTHTPCARTRSTPAMDAPASRSSFVHSRLPHLTAAMRGVQFICGTGAHARHTTRHGHDKASHPRARDIHEVPAGGHRMTHETNTKPARQARGARGRQPSSCSNVRTQCGLAQLTSSPRAMHCRIASASPARAAAYSSALRRASREEAEPIGPLRAPPRRAGAAPRAAPRKNVKSHQNAFSYCPRRSRNSISERARWFVAWRRWGACVRELCPRRRGASGMHGRRLIRGPRCWPVKCRRPLGSVIR